MRLAAIGRWLVVMALAWLMFQPTGAQPRSLAGRWQLVEQSYGEGRSNLADVDAELILEFTGGDPQWRGSIRTGPGASARHGWPAFVTDGRPAPVALQRLNWSAAGDSVRAEYRVHPSAGDDLVLFVVEEYRLDPGGADLLGTVTVTFERGGGTAGSYTLRRRLVRRP